MCAGDGSEKNAQTEQRGKISDGVTSRPRWEVYDMGKERRKERPSARKVLNSGVLIQINRFVSKETKNERAPGEDSEGTSER